ncbi:NAD synthetase [Phormidium tenue FACHB-886]|nr:NAD synthetase [Phormidium tenue FACHB-886]
MQNPAWLDWIAGGLAIAILLGGLFLLLKGVSAMGQKKQ